MQCKLRYPLGKGFHCGTNDLTSLFLRLLRWLSYKPFVPLPLGAGKTTTFSMLTGDLSISQGTAYMDGYNILTNLRQVCKKIGTGSESNFQLSINSNLGCFGSTLLCFVIGPENPCHPPNQLDAKLKTVATLSFAFSRASSTVLVSLWVLLGKWWC